MTNDVLEAAKAAVKESAEPMTVSQIAAAIKGKGRIPNRKDFPAEMRKALPGEAGVYPWPDFRRGPIFCSRPLSECAEEALLRFLDEKPLASTGEAKATAGKAVAKALRYISGSRAVKEIDALLPQLTTSGRVIRLAANRQAGVYVTRGWMAKQVGAGKIEESQADDEEAALAPAILATVRRLQMLSGTYARVDRLRKAGEICGVLDKAILQLAASGRLVLGRYDGVRPVPDDDKWMYVEDAAGELFIGIALPRGSEEGA